MAIPRLSFEKVAQPPPVREQILPRIRRSGGPAQEMALSVQAAEEAAQ